MNVCMGTDKGEGNSGIWIDKYSKNYNIQVVLGNKDLRMPK